jgi:hypothetical protein
MVTLTVNAQDERLLIQMDILGIYFISGGSVVINVEGLRQDDTLPPILFNVVVDILTILIIRAKTERKRSGVVPHLVDGG